MQQSPQNYTMCEAPTDISLGTSLVFGNNKRTKTIVVALNIFNISESIIMNCS